MIKIAAYEVRNDEEKYMRTIAKKYGVELVTTEEPLTEQTISLSRGAYGVTTLGVSKVDSDIIESLAKENIRVIATRTIGYDHIDVKVATENGIHVCNGYYDPDGVAEYTVMLMLMALRNYKQALYRANANDYSLQGLKGVELRNLTVGIIGIGKIGLKTIEKLQGFGCNIIAYNRHEVPHEGINMTYCTLEELYEKSDIISLHVPLSTNTRHMINRESLKKMKDGVILINCARGELMCIDDLIYGIESKKIGALALDVVEEEEGIYHRDLRSDILINRNMAYIRQFPNVTMTQHMAFYTEEAVKSMAESGIENIMRCVHQEKNANLIC